MTAEVDLCERYYSRLAMNANDYLCEEGERMNAQLIKQDQMIVVEPSQTQAGYDYRVTEGKEKLDSELPCEKLIEVTECNESYAEVKVLSNSLRDLV
jgi:hypothetical protein